MINILDDDVFTAIHEDGHEIKANLPGLLSLMGRERITTLKRVRAYQEHAMHLFLTQLAAMALDGNEARGRDLAEIDTVEWRSLLLSLGEHHHWDLVAESPEASAFMQPAISREDFESSVKKGVDRSPDALSDLYHKSKLHVSKVGGGRSYEPCDWIFALIDRQTLSGYGGPGHYGIARMNGGYGCRLAAAVYPAGALWSDMWTRDTQRLQQLLPTVYRTHPLFEQSGPRHSLLWTLPWDGKSQIPLRDIHPYFIEVCRRIRLFMDDGEIASTEATSGTNRVDASSVPGADLADPWSPTELVEDNDSSYVKVLTPKNFGATLLKNIILGEGGIRPSPLQHLEDNDRAQDMVFHASVLMGGQGKTEGFHSARVPIPSRVAVALFGGSLSSGKQQISRLAKEMVDSRAQFEKIIAVTIGEFVKMSLNGSSKSSSKSYLEKRCKADFNIVAERYFFPDLWAAADSGDIAVWIRRLHRAGEKIVDSTIGSHGLRASKSVKAAVLARAKYDRLCRHHFNKELHNGD